MNLPIALGLIRKSPGPLRITPSVCRSFSLDEIHRSLDQSAESGRSRRVWGSPKKVIEVVAKVLQLTIIADGRIIIDQFTLD